MNHLRIVREVARWEFSRFFKLKEQLYTLLVFLGVALLFWGGKALTERMGAQQVRVAVLRAEVLPLTFPPEGRFVLVPAEGREEAELRAAVARREIDAVLVLHGSDSAELVVHRSPPWRGELQALLNAARHQSRLRSVDLTPEELADLLAPVRIALTYQGAEGRLPGRAERVAAGMAIALMLMGVFVGTAYLFSGITGEKQLRVTELVISAISPQAWIDGKILGLSALSLVLVLNYAVSTVLVLGMSHLFGPGIAIPGAAVRPAFLAQFVVLGVLGFFFWFAFFAAIAATIDDPNSSARTTWLLFPVLTLGVAFLAVRQPDALVFRVLGVLPFTSPTVLPARWMLSEVALWEFLVAVALLVPSIWLLRRAAGKIFALGMLTYGKEPEWREMWRWVKEA